MSHCPGRSDWLWGGHAIWSKSVRCHQTLVSFGGKGTSLLPTPPEPERWTQCLCSCCPTGRGKPSEDAPQSESRARMKRGESLDPRGVFRTCGLRSQGTHLQVPFSLLPVDPDPEQAPELPIRMPLLFLLHLSKLNILQCRDSRQRSPGTSAAPARGLHHDTAEDMPALSLHPQ